MNVGCGELIAIDTCKCWQFIMKPKVKDESSIQCTVFQQFQHEDYK